jgi:hypothetical protein
MVAFFEDMETRIVQVYKYEMQISDNRWCINVVCVIMI